MKFVKMTLVGGTRGGVEVSGGVRALLLPVSDLSAEPWGQASSSYSPVKSAGGLLQRLYWIQDPETITIELWLWFFQMG